MSFPFVEHFYINQQQKCFHEVVEAGWPHTSVVSMKDAEEALEWV